MSDATRTRVIVTVARVRVLLEKMRNVMMKVRHPRSMNTLSCHQNVWEEGLLVLLGCLENGFLMVRTKKEKAFQKNDALRLN